MSDEGQTVSEKDSGEEGYQTEPNPTTNAENQSVSENEETTTETVEKFDWLPEKFKTPEQLVQSYKSLESKFHTRKEDFKKNIMEEMASEANKDVPAPGDYEINIEAPEGMEFNIDENDPVLGWFRNTAHDLGLNQKEFEGYVKEFIAMDNARGPDWNEEVTKLGEHAERRLERVDTWANSHLSEESYNKFANMRADAQTVQLFEELMELNGQPKFNMQTSDSFQEKLSREDLQSMQQDPKYWKDKDPAFIAKVRQGFKQFTNSKG